MQTDLQYSRLLKFPRRYPFNNNFSKADSFVSAVVEMWNKLPLANTVAAAMYTFKMGYSNFNPNYPPKLS